MVRLSTIVSNCPSKLDNDGPRCIACLTCLQHGIPWNRADGLFPCRSGRQNSDESKVRLSQLQLFFLHGLIIKLLPTTMLQCYLMIRHEMDQRHNMNHVGSQSALGSNIFETPGHYPQSFSQHHNYFVITDHYQSSKWLVVSCRIPKTCSGIRSHHSQEWLKTNQFCGMKLPRSRKQIINGPLRAIQGQYQPPSS